ncbi:hypothetical protein CHS0354_018280 [Potamilus streckersoni]|uniref:Uncharacterized protein n=1 Tax=Potamilus streckersoni TaxID=2493646 RepID=A0AAE0RQF0_9BIVA|nr:hypothetical protein CHS0354_018280 [Potamilus streckersoni]
MKKVLQTYKQQQANIAAEYNNELLEWNRQSNNQREYKLEKERDKLLNRLSKLAEGRPTHDNTNITDLSDANRPTKLSEAYSELYDNECTDAFEELTLPHGFDEKDTIAKLLNIILVVINALLYLISIETFQLKDSIALQIVV